MLPLVPDIHYYTTDGKIFTNKVQALLYAYENRVNVNLYYHDHIYKSLNWNEELKESLDYYYLEQAVRIRQNYDKVILCYSGGFDSTNILETFYYNGLEIDKLVAVGSFSQDKHSGDNVNCNGDVYSNAFPIITKLNLGNKFQVIDFTDFFDKVKNFSVIDNWGTDWIEHMGSRLSPNHWFWKDLEKHVVPTEWRDFKVAIIIGLDKPLLLKQETQFYFQFSDKVLLTHGGNIMENQNQPSNINRIFFYWDPDYPFILVKQLQVLKRVQSLHPDNENYANDHRDAILYNIRNPLIRRDEKSLSGVFSKRDNYLLSKLNSDVFKIYQEGIKKLDRKLGTIGRFKMTSTIKYFI